jgi:hypothetical protein
MASAREAAARPWLPWDLRRLTQDHARPAEDFHRLRPKYGLRLAAVADVRLAWHRRQLPDHPNLSALAETLAKVSPQGSDDPAPDGHAVSSKRP